MIWEVTILWESIFTATPESLVNKVPDFYIKKETLGQVFLCEFCKNFQEYIFYRTPPDYCFWHLKIPESFHFRNKTIQKILLYLRTQLYYFKYGIIHLVRTQDFPKN